MAVVLEGANHLVGACVVDLGGSRFDAGDDKESYYLLSCSSSGEVVMYNVDDLTARKEGLHETEEKKSDVRGNVSALTLLAKTPGSPAAVCFDETCRNAYVADMAYGAIIHVDENGSVKPIVNDYEGMSLLGPSSLTFGPDGTLFFTDSGPLGETSLERPRGSVFAITRDENGQLLRPLVYSSLAHPCAICVSRDGSVFVAEMLRNRILRLVRHQGAYHCSVFYQFNGRFGPSAIACSDTALYVARFDFDEKLPGLISVLDLGDGAAKPCIQVNTCGPQITGLAFFEPGQCLFITEATTKRIIQI